MATETGTATDYRDLLAKLRDFLVTDVGWTQIGGQVGTIASDADYVSVQGPGLTDDDQIMVTLKPFSAPDNNAYSLGIRGHTAYVDPGYDQPGSDSPWAYMLLHDASITYWFIGNGRRFIVIAKIGSRYNAMYGGFILPEHLPSDWSYPLFVGASCYLNTVPESDDNQYHSNFWNPVAQNASNPALSGAYIFSPMQAWVPVRNAIPGSGQNYDYRYTGRMTVPWTRMANQNMRRLLDDTPYLRRGQVAAFARDVSGAADTNVPEGGQFYGSFDGVFYTPAFGATAEQEVTVASVTYKMFPNVGRTADGHFAAIAME